ncbi:glycoside hydrolase family 18 protein [Longitalea luteola]|uniref:glycoside hydrolase family 18 protein n=1 Tax=Longitalea luteola TaxID=2812563 RepID=UPI001A960458|nr:glycosyl hydrolase family 18 protein [Longitalea luteola]
MRFLLWLLVATGISGYSEAADTARRPFSVIAYYSGNSTDIDRYDIQPLTHIIYSFALLKNNRLYVSAAAGSILKKLVSLKKKNPSLKVALAFGGWGGCKTCSNVFAVPGNRTAFAQSVLAILQQYQLDGIDIDWEYPAIDEGPAGHPYSPADKQNFTELISAVRQALGNRYELSFAAGVFPEYLYNSIEWQQVMPLVDRVHLMSYDMVNRKSAATGHHSALYSTPFQVTSIDNTIRFLDSLRIARNKVVIGAAFYARTYITADTNDHGLYRPAVFKDFAVYKSYPRRFAEAGGFTGYWDDTAKVPYCFNPETKQFATFDDERSVAHKTKYALSKGLNGLLFWELRQDDSRQRLLNAIANALENAPQLSAR